MNLYCMCTIVTTSNDRNNHNVGWRCCSSSCVVKPAAAAVQCWTAGLCRSGWVEVEVWLLLQLRRNRCFTSAGAARVWSPVGFPQTSTLTRSSMWLVSATCCCLPFSWGPKESWCCRLGRQIVAAVLHVECLFSCEFVNLMNLHTSLQKKITSQCVMWSYWVQYWFHWNVIMFQFRSLLNVFSSKEDEMFHVCAVSWVSLIGFCSTFSTHTSWV